LDIYSYEGEKMDVFGFVMAILAISAFLFVLFYRIRHKEGKKSLLVKIIDAILTIFDQN
jgi:hypothetical protein